MAWIKKQKADMNLSIWVFKNNFSRYYEAWSGINTTDRALFCRLYEIILEEKENMKKVKSNYINCAFNEAVAVDEAIMQGIVDYFTGKVKRGHGDSTPQFYATPEVFE